MVDYPYANVISNLRKFIDGIPSRGIPAKVDAEYLKQVGFTSYNDVAIVSVLEFIGFVGKDGKPTDDYTNFRISTKQEETMSRCLKIAYADLFKLYPDAPERENQELVDFFTSKTTSGELVVKRMVGTFLLLCEFSESKPPKKKSQTKVASTKPKVKKTSKAKKKPAEETSFEINKQPQVVINIQLVLPESKDPSLYDELFKSLRKHLLE